MLHKSTNREEGSRLHDLLKAVCKVTWFDHPVNQFEVVETHISLILLTGPFAYKFKKPVNLGFLDFSTLEKRKHYCEEEVRLNGRVSPELYLGVVSFTGSEQHPELQGNGPVIEYAVKMLQFPKYSELQHALNNGRLSTAHIDDLARQIAAFHSLAGVVSGTHYEGTPHCIRRQVMENFQLLSSKATNLSADSETLAILEDWTFQSLESLKWEFALRKQRGHVRECHGDLHLGNIILLNDQLRLFDCIEFSTGLRMIDVMSDVAFLCMDFDTRERPGIAWRFLNGYLQQTGDYPGLSVFRFYMVYRAMVRAKIACIRLEQSGLTREQQSGEQDKLRHYIDKAVAYSKPGTVRLLITHGLSGSGKTCISRQILEVLGAVRIRSDVERKRLHDLTIDEKSESAPGAGLYTREKSRQTNQWLAHMAGVVLNAGYPVIIDATFLQAVYRDQMETIARELEIPFVILDFHADDSTLRSRILHRSEEGGDASEADIDVLEWQMNHREPLRPGELRRVVTIDTSTTVDIDGIVRKINAMDSRGTHTVSRFRSNQHARVQDMPGTGRPV